MSLIQMSPLEYLVQIARLENTHFELSLSLIICFSECEQSQSLYFYLETQCIRLYSLYVLFIRHNAVYVLFTSFFSVQFEFLIQETVSWKEPEE
jgi:hypothetical protein